MGTRLKRPLSMVVCLSIIFSMMFTVNVYAAAGDVGELTLKVAAKNITKADATYAVEGDVIEVTVSSQNAEWTTVENQTICAFQLGLNYNATYLEMDTSYGDDSSGVKKEVNPEGFTTTASTPSGQVMLLFVNSGTSAWAMGDVVLLTARFKVKNSTGVNTPLEFTFEANDCSGSYGPSISATDFNITDFVTDSSISVDSLKPEIKLDSSAVADAATPTFYFKPVKVEFGDGANGAGIDTATFGGNAIASGAEITENGPLVVTDKAGNETTVTITIESGLYDAAKEAIDNIPTPVKYDSSTLVADARTKYDAVTDATAKGKLDGTKLTAAEQALLDFPTAITAAINKINTLPDPVTYADKATIAEARNMVNALVVDCNVPESQITNLAKLTAAEAVITTVQGVIDEIKRDINTLADEFSYGQKDIYTGLQTRITNAKTTYSLADTDFDSAALVRLKGFLDKITQTETDIGNLDTSMNALPVKASVKYDNKAAVSTIETEYNRLKQIGVTDTAYTNLAKFTDAKEVIEAIASKITSIEQDITALGDFDYAKVADYTALNNRIQALVNDDNVVVSTDIDAAAVAKLNLLLGNVAAITALDGNMANLPAKASVVYNTHKGDITAAWNEYTRLKNLGVTDDAYTAGNLLLLTEAHGVIAKIDEDIAALDEKLALLPAKEDIAYSDIEKIEGLRDEYDRLKALTVQDGAYTNLAKLDAAEQGVADLNTSISQAKAAMAALPDSDDIKYTDKTAINAAKALYQALKAKNVPDDKFTSDNVTQLNEAIEALNEIQDKINTFNAKLENLPEGDSVVLNDKARLDALVTEFGAKLQPLDVAAGDVPNYTKITAAYDEIDQIYDDGTTLDGEFNALTITTATVKHSDINVLQLLQEELTRLASRGLAISVDNYSHLDKYMAAGSAVGVMQAEIAGLNARMDDVVANWKLNATATYTAILADKDAMATKYAAPNSAFDLSKITTAQQQETDAQADISSAKTKIQALPTTVTEANRAEVNAVMALINKLKAAPYKIPEATIRTALTVSGADLYQQALNANLVLNPVPVPPVSTPPTTNAPATTHTEAAAATGGSPQTGDNSNMVLWVLLVFASMSGLLVSTVVIWRKRQKLHQSEANVAAKIAEGRTKHYRAK